MNASRTSRSTGPVRSVKARADVAAVADPESRIHDDHHESLRLWLRLLTCTMLIERRIRAGLREAFATTLPRFDLMAQLERNPAGLKMGELSRRLMVTGGNVTAITDQLVAEGLVERRAESRTTGAPTRCGSRPKASAHSIPWRLRTSGG